MRPEDRDAAYLWDMLQAARDAVAITSGVTVGKLRDDRMRLLALERSLELVGEAARRVSAAFREQHPQIPWREMIGLRNILAHEYGRIDHVRLHATAVNDVRRLIAALEKLLPPEK